MSWLLDTDVISQPAKRRGDPRVVAWLGREKDQCYTTAVVLAQLAYWVGTKEGRQREQLAPHGPIDPSAHYPRHYPRHSTLRTPIVRSRHGFVNR